MDAVLHPLESPGLNVRFNPLALGIGRHLIHQDAGGHTQVADQCDGKHLTLSLQFNQLLVNLEEFIRHVPHHQRQVQMVLGMDHEQGYGRAVPAHLLPDQVRLYLVGGHHAVVRPAQRLPGLVKFPLLGQTDGLHAAAPGVARLGDEAHRHFHAVHVLPSLY